MDTQAYLFSPRRSVEEHRRTMRLARKTKVQPTQANRAYEVIMTKFWRNAQGEFQDWGLKCYP